MIQMTKPTFDMEYAPGWRPSEGDVIVGKVVELSKNWSTQTNSFYPIITIEKEGGEKVAIHCFHFALKQKVLELRPQVGETIGCQFIGKRPQKNNASRTVAVYGFKVKGRTADIYADIQQEKPGQRQSSTSDIPASSDDFAPQDASNDDDDIPF